MIGVVEADDITTMFEALGKRNWNANGAASPWLKHLGLDRSLMTVGDVIETDDGRWFQVAKAELREVQR